MNFYGLNSIIEAGKKTFAIKDPTESFCVSSERNEPYIEPNFDKVIFEQERPVVICVSAVGATGKSSLAQVLSNQTGLPLLDLGTYKPVGANSLTGILTSSFDSSDLTGIFSGLEDGSFGIIIDGIDEGRSKTTQMGFEAFLDDIVQRCAGSTKTSFVLLGRTQTLEECFFYLNAKGLTTGLINILPFDLEQARNYIDRYTSSLGSVFETQYKEARDLILEKLGAAFDTKVNTSNENFLSFIGYPPVLDAIVTLLFKEQNYYKLLQEIKTDDSDDVEIGLLHRIAYYVLRREKEQKVVPIILNPILSAYPDEIKKEIIQTAYQEHEQCLRLVSYSLGQPHRINRIEEPSINEKYEKQMESWLPEHPFLNEGKFRNTVFESVALATLMISDDPRCLELVRSYARSNKRSYYLVYLLDKITSGHFLNIDYLDILVDSALEFRSSNSYVHIDVDGPDYDNVQTNSDIEIDIEILLGKEREKTKKFSFQSNLENITIVTLGNHLAETYVTLPCDVVFLDSQDLDFVAPVAITAKNIEIKSKILSLRSSTQKGFEDSIMLEASKVNSALEVINDNGVTFSVAVSDMSGLTYPISQYAQQRSDLPSDGQLKEKYLRLKRILMEFRAHGRGSLARHQMKIESERVLRNKTGELILKRLIADQILTSSGGFYHIQSEELDKHFDMSWPDWKQDRISERLLEYLRSIQVP